MRSDNPYYANGYISPDYPRYADLYVERSGIDDQILGRLNRGSGPLGSYIYGSRQSGKTSLIYHLRSKMKAWSVVLVSLRPLEADKEKSWYRQVWDQLLSGLNLSDDQYPSDAFEFSSCLRRLDGRVRGLGVLVVWDEVDALLTDNSGRRAAAQFLAELRALKQSDYGTPFVRWAFVMAALQAPDLFYQEIASQWTDHNSPPFNHLEPFQLHDWGQSDTQRLGQLLRPTHSAEESTLERVHWWTEGHPYLTQRLLGWLYDQENQVLSSADVDRGAEEVSHDPRHMIQHLESHVRALSDAQRGLLKDALHKSRAWNTSLSDQRHLETVGFIKRDPSANLVIVRNPLYWRFLNQVLTEPERIRLDEDPTFLGVRSPTMLVQAGVSLSSILLGVLAGMSLPRIIAVQSWLSAALAACASKAPLCTAGLFTAGLAGITGALTFLAVYLSIWHVCVNSQRKWGDPEVIDQTSIGGPTLTLRFGQTTIPGDVWTVKAELDPEQDGPVSIAAEGDQIEPEKRCCELTRMSPQNEIRLICRRGSRVRDFLTPWPSRWDVVLHIRWAAYTSEGRKSYTLPKRVPVIVDSQIAIPRLMPTALKAITNLGGEVLKNVVGSKKTP